MSGSGYCNYSAITSDGKVETRTAPLSSKYCAPFVSIVQPSTETSLVPPTEPTPEALRLDVVQQALSYIMTPSKVSCPESLSDVAYPSCAAPAGIENNTCLMDLLNYIQSKANRIGLECLRNDPTAARLVDKKLNEAMSEGVTHQFTPVDFIVILLISSAAAIVVVHWKRLCRPLKLVLLAVIRLIFNRRNSGEDNPPNDNPPSYAQASQPPDVVSHASAPEDVRIVPNSNIGSRQKPKMGRQALRGRTVASFSGFENDLGDQNTALVKPITHFSSDKRGVTRIVIVGPEKVGKSTLVLQACNDPSAAPINNSVGTRPVSLAIETRIIRCEVTDVPSDPEAASTEAYRDVILDADIIILIYDIQRPQTLDHLRTSLFASLKDINPKATMYLFGNKDDPPAYSLSGQESALEPLRISPDEIKLLSDEFRVDNTTASLLHDVDAATMVLQRALGIHQYLTVELLG